MMQSQAQGTSLLNLRERELELLLALDAIRDSAADPAAMLASLGGALLDRLNADLYLISVVDRASGQPEVKSTGQRGPALASITPEAARRLAGHAFTVSRIMVWGGAELETLGLLPGAPADLRVAAVPILLRGARLGVAILARVGDPFSEAEVQLMRVAERQLDSAVIQGYAYYDLQQRNKELEVIYRIDRIRDQHLPFDEMLNAVLVQLRDVIGGEMGFIMLYNRAGKRLELRAVTHEDLLRASPYAETINRVANDSLERAALVCENDLDGELGSILCVPLILNESILGVLGVANRAGGAPFDDEDRRLLAAIASQMDTAIFEGLEQRRLRAVLGRSVDPRVMSRLLDRADTDFLKGERMEVTVLYADIRGSTSLAERTDPELLVGFINDYLGTMTDVILANQGTLDKFVGDEVMALFGAPFPQEDQTLRAIRCALAMQEAYHVVMDRWAALGVEPSPIGIGIATGDLIAGEMGSTQRTGYTVIGRSANLGARICSAAFGGHVWISESAYEAVGDRIDVLPISGLEMKGVTGLVTVYQVTGIRE